MISGLKLQLSEADPPELHAFVEHQRLKNLASTTIDMRTRLVRLFAAWLGRPLASASVADLRAFVAARRDRLARASQATEISYLKAFYSALLQLGLVSTNPADGVQSWRTKSPRRPISLLCVRALLLEASRPDGGPPVRRRGYTEAQGLALAKRDRACLELLFATGMRASEVRAARVVDLDLEDASVMVRRAKRGPAQRLPLPAPTVEALRRYLLEGRSVLQGSSDDSGYLFLTKDARRLGKGALGALVGRVAKRAGVKAYPHVFRRTLATELTRAGVSLPVIQKILGHAHLSTTSDYVHVEIDEMRAGLDSLAQGLPKSHTETGLFDNLQCRLFGPRQVAVA